MKRLIRKWVGRLDRYILRTFAESLGISAAVCVGLYMVIDFMDKLDDIVRHPWKEALFLCALHYLFLLPTVLSYCAAPIALMACLAVVARMMRNHELLLLPASGVPIHRIFQSLLIPSLALSAFLFLNQEFLIPNAVPLSEKYERRLLQNEVKEEDAIFNNPQLTADSQGRIFQAAQYDILKRRLYQATIVEWGSPGPRVTVAKEARYEPRAGWRLFDGKSQAPVDNGLRLEQTVIPVQGMLLQSDMTPQDIMRKEIDPELLDLHNLGRQIRHNPAMASLRVNFWQRFLVPFTTVLLPALGLPLLLRRRDQRTQSLAWGMVLLFTVSGLFFFVLMLCTTLGAQAVLSAPTAALLPFLIFGAAAAWEIRRIPT